MIYTTISETAGVMENKTNAFKTFLCSDDIDLGLVYQKCSGMLDGHAKVTIKKPDGSLITKTAEAGEVKMINTYPPKAAVLLLSADLDFNGVMWLFPEWKIDDSWVQDDPVRIEVEADPTSFTPPTETA